MNKKIKVAEASKFDMSEALKDEQDIIEYRLIFSHPTFRLAENLSLHNTAPAAR